MICEGIKSFLYKQNHGSPEKFYELGHRTCQFDLPQSMLKMWKGKKVEGEFPLPALSTELFLDL